ncbi:hypothetical protein BJ322DRAFT_1210255 [Thelephora terrestris]|uniref:Uncharacterized protein n=1 Tax=Thelephora terrestris TaxID=56493 RepID=A0A9P6HJR1_9AGAM|nr:hypothetical protein BJ322DRAFT_1210255 [Thelephora terrestris]
MLSLSARSIPKRSLVSQRAVARLYSSTVHDNNPDTLEIEKQRNLAQKQHLTSTPIHEAPGWNESLATSSEANVKADQSSDTPEALVSRTVKYVKSRYSAEDRVGSREATYERESIEGPLAPDSSDTPGSKVKVKTERFTEEILEGATSSEEAVGPSLVSLASGE